MSRTLAVVGLGNIGSQLVPHLARLPEVTTVILVDKGAYDRTNIVTQAITAGEVGRLKARVQRFRLARIRPSLRVTAIALPVEQVPLGRLRADAILACVDNRATRQYLNQTARHLGVPLIDAGVFPDGLLARVSVFLPGAVHACLECTWDEADYDAVEQSYPCQSGIPDATPTGAPAHLGALSAAVQAIECRRQLDLPAGAAEGSYEIVIDAASRRAHLTRLVRNGTCRVPEHEPWVIRRIARLPETITVAEALAFGTRRRTAAGASLCLDGVPFVAAMTCLGCGRRASVWRVSRSIARRARLCRQCGGRREAVGADILPRLTRNDVPARVSAASLRALGFRTGDVFTVAGEDGTRHYELAEPAVGGSPN